MGCLVFLTRDIHMLKTRDLGNIEGDLLLFGGPYSNLHALSALLDIAQREDIGANNMICTGDVCGYCADAETTAQRMIALNCPTVAGNCDEQLGYRRDDCGCGFEEGAACDLLSVEWYNHANSQLRLNYYRIHMVHLMALSRVIVGWPI